MIEVKEILGLTVQGSNTPLPTSGVGKRTNQEGERRGRTKGGFFYRDRDKEPVKRPQLDNWRKKGQEKGKILAS